MTKQDKWMELYPDDACKRLRMRRQESNRCTRCGRADGIDPGYRNCRQCISNVRAYYLAKKVAQ